MDAHFETVGPISLRFDKAFIVKRIYNANMEEFYVCKNKDAFVLPENQEKTHDQRIWRMISKTAFTSIGPVELNAFSDEERETKTTLKQYFTEAEESLKSLFELCEGADSADLKKFRHCSKIHSMTELKKDFNSNLSLGLGFPGTGYALIHCTFEEPVRIREAVLLQIVHSYMEGYSVEHQELTRELMKLSQLPITQEIFAKMGKDKFDISNLE